MDADRFDALSRAVALSRRTVLSALGATVAALLAGPLGQPRPLTARTKRRHQQEPTRLKHPRRDQRGAGRRQDDISTTAKKRRKSTSEGPCGDGSSKANACTKDNDCCTRYCHKKKGRCRCKKLGQGCEEDRNCCAHFGQPMTCQNNTCQTVQTPPPSPPPPLPPPPPPPDPAGTCTAQQPDICESFDFEAANCNGTPGCSCYTTTADTRFCGLDITAFGLDAGDCDEDADCGEGAVCVKESGQCHGSDPPGTFCLGRACTSTQTCRAEDDLCDDPVARGAVSCGGTVSDPCYCFITDEGEPVCAHRADSGACPCEPGEVCVNCGDTNRCQRPCENSL